MGRYKIPPDAWKAATLALLRYQETKAGIKDAQEEAMTSDPEARGHGPRQSYPDPVPAAVAKLEKNKKYNRMKRELWAVENAMEGLTDSQKEVIRQRFWDHGSGYRHTCPYQYMRGTHYSEAGMKKIVGHVVERVARNLGEI